MMGHSDGGHLRTNAIGLVAAATLGIVFMSPALGFYGDWGPVASNSGGASPFVFIVAALVIAPTALSYAFVSRRLPSAGSAYTWVGRATNRHVGDWLGWVMLPYYVLNICTATILFGLFFNAFLGEIGLHVALNDYGTFILGVLIAFAVPALLALMGIATSSKAATIIVSFEVAVIAALSTTILVKSFGRLTLQPFDPAAGHITFNSFWLAMPLAAFAYVGFDVVSIAAEETKLARQAIPKATLIAVVLFTIFLIYTAYAFSFAVPVPQLNALMALGITPVTPIAHQFWGGAAILISITGMTAGMGATVAILVGASRIMFAMARDGALPTPILRLNRSGSPWVAMALILVIDVLYDFIASAWIGPLNAFIWVGTAITFFALVTYMFVNIGSFLLHYRDTEFNWWWHGVIPFCGVLFTIALIYEGFLQGLWSAGWVTIGRGIVVFVLLWTGLGLAYTFAVRSTRRVGGDAADAVIHRM